MSDSNQLLLDTIIGSPLIEVVFIHDYIQLGFDDYRFPRLTAYTLPQVHVGTGWLKYREVGYCDALCSCIGQVVQRALVRQDGETGEDVELYIEFSDGSIISVSTNPADFVPGQVEAAMLTTEVGWEVWV